VERGRHELVHDGEERPGPVGHDFDRLAMGAERGDEESPRRLGVALGRDVDVDDLAVLINGPVDVAPPARDLHVGLIHAPTVADRLAARPGCIGQRGREALHPSVHGDVIDLDATLTEELLDVAVGEPVPEVPAHRQDDDLGREPEPGERRTRDFG
jgi:hypothetical protein